MNYKKTGQKILHFPLVKILLSLIVLGIIISISKWLIKNTLNLIDINSDYNSLIIGISTAVISIITYKYFFKFYEKRLITEFSKNTIVKSTFFGIIIGVLLQSLTILIIYLKGGYFVVSINPILFIIPALTMAFTSAIFEEIMVRGIIFRIMEEKFGSYIALFISALLFGAMHLNNENSSAIAALGLAIQAGLLLGAAFIYSRNLWFPIAIHFAWNFTQSAIYGARVSGMQISKTLITSKIEGDIWFTGGEFGPEGSIQATLFCLVATIVLLILAHKKGNLIKPFWRK